MLKFSKRSSLSGEVADAQPVRLTLQIQIAAELRKSVGHVGQTREVLAGDVAEGSDPADLHQ
jgi:hypothetical protein